MIPVLAAGSPLVALPSITSHFGKDAWAAVAIGQSIGAALATLVELGWGLNGPQRVARMSPKNSYQAIVVSAQAKLLVLAPALVISAAFAFVLAPSHRGDAAAVAVAAVSAALSVSWFYLGKSRPWTIVASDAVPRLIFLVAASVLIARGAPLLTYPILGILSPSLIAPLIGVAIARPTSSQRSSSLLSFRRLLRVINAQLSALSARAASAAYIALPVTLVSIGAPATVPVFAAGERLMRIGLSAISIVPNAMQGWVGSTADRNSRNRRVRISILLNSGFGLVAAILFGTLAPWVSGILFSGVATVPPSIAWLFALVVLIVTVSRATGGLALVAQNKVRAVALSAVAGAVVGVPAILVLSHLLGMAGGVLGEIAAESAVLFVQLRFMSKDRSAE